MPRLSADTVPLIGRYAPVRADGRYAVTKAFGEQLGRYYAEAEGMESVSVRLGTISLDDRPASDSRSFVSWFSHRDLGDLFAACIEKPELNCEVVYGASANTWKVYDTPGTWEVLGIKPRDNAEEYR